MRKIIIIFLTISPFIGIAQSDADQIDFRGYRVRKVFWERTVKLDFVFKNFVGPSIQTSGLIKLKYQFKDLKNPDAIVSEVGSLDLLTNEKLKYKKKYFRTKVTTFRSSIDKDSITSLISKIEGDNKGKKFTHEFTFKNGIRINAFGFLYRGKWYCFLKSENYILLRFGNFKNYKIEEVIEILESIITTKTCR